jgi:hypothetical protein
MKTEYPKILDSRDQSTMASRWTEYLRLSKPSNDSALLEICQYESLAWDGVPEELPDEIDGKKVVGVEDGIIIGGDLVCRYDTDSFQFTKQTLPDAISWLGDNWKSSDRLLRKLAIAIGASITKTIP